MSAYATRIRQNIYRLKLDLGYENRSIITKISIILFDPMRNLVLVLNNNMRLLDMISTNIQQGDNLDKALTRLCDNLLDIYILNRSTRLYDEYNLNLIYVINLDECNNDKIFDYFIQHKDLIWIHQDKLYDLYLIKNTHERNRHLDIKLQYNLIYTELYAIKNKRVPVDFKVARFNQPILCYLCVRDKKYDDRHNYPNYKWIGAKRYNKEVCYY